MEGTSKTAARRDEDEAERLDRELIELLNELRVALPGVQVLFAFLLAVPFANGFPKLGRLDRDIFFAAFIATALSTVLLIAPSSYHRLRWRQHDKERMLVVSNILTIAGLASLAVAITCTPAAASSGTTAPPTPPAAPVTRARSPASNRPPRSSANAVSPGIGRLAAWSAGRSSDSRHAACVTVSRRPLMSM